MADPLSIGEDRAHVRLGREVGQLDPADLAGEDEADAARGVLLVTIVRVERNEIGPGVITKSRVFVRPTRRTRSLTQEYQAYLDNTTHDHKT